MPRSHTPVQPARETFSGADAEAYARVVARQTAYNYPEYRKTMPEYVLEAFDDSFSPSGDEAAPEDRIQGYMGAMLNAPQVMDHISELGVLFRNNGERDDSYQHSDREWVDMVLGQEMECWGVFYAHMPDGVANGLRVEALRALRSGRDEEFTREELIKTRHVRQVLNGKVTPESYAAVVELFGRRGALDFTQFIAFLIMTNRLLQALGAQDLYTPEMVDQLITDIENGGFTLPDPAARIPSKIAAH